MKFTLPISPEYVAHWGLWEAVREIYQNALDESDKADLRYIAPSAEIRISTPTGHLTPQSLVLGNTSKRNDPAKRGKFGEGYKLALLVLARLGHGVLISNGSECWTSQLIHDDAFDSTVLQIETERSLQPVEGVTFVIRGVTDKQFEIIKQNVRPSDAYSAVLEQPVERGRIYVGGLYVSTAKEFHCGYSFPPSAIKLDRDRGMVDGFDLSYATSNLWTYKDNRRAMELLEAEAPDVRYVESHAKTTSPMVIRQASYFTERHGAAAIPVSSQEEIEQATSAGMKWVLVPAAVKSLLGLVKSWFIPSTQKPLERIIVFKRKHEWQLNREAIKELEEIIKSMEDK